MKRYNYIYVALASLIWLACGLPAASQNVIEIDKEINVSQLGDTISIPVSLTNTDEVVAVQMDVVVSSDISQIWDDNWNWKMQLSERATDHSLVCNDVYDRGNYTYKVMVYSANNAVITGNAGELLSLKVKLSNYNANKDYTIKLSNIMIVGSNGNDIATQKEASCTLKHQPVGPDLVVKDLSADKKSYKAGDVVNIKYNVKNVGDASTEGGWQKLVRMYNVTGANPDYKWENEDTEIAAGATVERSFSWTVPADSVYHGLYVIRSQVYGANEDLNYHNEEISNDTLVVGNSFRVSANRTSFGDETDKNEYYITLERYGDTSQAIDVKISCSADRLHIQSTAHFDAGVASIQIPYRVKNNNVIDEDQYVYVTFETEGYGQEQLSIRIQDDDTRDYVDLSVTDLTFDADKEYAPGDEVRISYTVSNKGTKALTNGWTSTISIRQSGRSISWKSNRGDQISINGSQQITETIQFPEFPNYGGKFEVQVQVESMGNDEPNQYQTDNTKTASSVLVLKKVIEFTEPAQLSFEELPERQLVEIPIRRSAYYQNSPAVTATSTNGRIVIGEDEKLPMTERCVLKAYIVDNHKVEESDEEVLTITVEGYDGPFTLTFNIKNDDVAMTEEHQLLQKFVEDEGLNTENWEKRWDFSESTISKNLDGVTFDEDMHVTEINLAGCNLSGELPRYLFDLPYLKDVYLAGNELSGKIEDVLGETAAKGDALRYIFIQDNDFEGNLGKFAEMLPSTVEALYASENKLTEVNPVLPENITAVELNNQRLGLEYELSMSDVNEEWFQKLPQIVMYDRANRELLGRTPDIYITTAGETEQYDKDKDFVLDVHYSLDGTIHTNIYSRGTHWYSGQSGDILFCNINNRAWMKIKFNFQKGDCNFDDQVNAQDIEATVLEVFERYPSPYNFTAGNTYEDEIINVQDVICTVNLALDNMAGTPTVAMASKTRSASDEAAVEARVYIANGKVMLKSDRKVAAFTIKSRGDITWTANTLGMTQATSEHGIVGYSLSGAYIPEGVTVLGTCGEGASIIDISLADEEAKAISSAIGDGSTTGIGSTMIDEGGNPRIYDLNGVRRNAVRKGVYIIEKDGKTKKVSINKK